jgi:predicted alpha-1,6-mannanase (GH76 family)
LKAWLLRIAAFSAMLGAVPIHAEENPWQSRAVTALDYLDRKWGKPGGWEGSEAWQRFVIADALIDYERRTGDRRWRPQIGEAVRNRSGLYLNDDDLWAVIANVHAWRLGGDPELLDYASSTYRRIVTTYWDDHCGGGLWWDRKRTYKNAITNELLLYASTQLYLATGQQPYRDWALRGWSWFAGSSMMGRGGLVNDGLDGACRNNGQPHFTYNQGVLLGGLTDLTTITGDPQYRAAAVRTALAATRSLSTQQGILREPVPSIGSDGLMFKGIFAYHLGHLIEDMPAGPERLALTDWVQANAQAVWKLSASGTRPIDADWSGSPSQSGPAAYASGIDMLLAATD